MFYAAAQTLAGGTRPDDLVGRWREDRFAALVVCPRRTDWSCGERLRRLVAQAAVPWWGDRLSVTVSMGGTMVRLAIRSNRCWSAPRKPCKMPWRQTADSVLVV